MLSRHGRQLSEKMVKLVVRSDPKPLNRVTGPRAHGAILLADPHRPKFSTALKLFETQRRMIRIDGKNLIRQPGTRFHRRWQLFVGTPEGRSDQGNHNLAGSSGSASPSRNAAAANCSVWDTSGGRRRCVHIPRHRLAAGENGRNPPPRAPCPRATLPQWPPVLVWMNSCRKTTRSPPFGKRDSTSSQMAAFCRKPLRHTRRR